MPDLQSPDPAEPRPTLSDADLAVIAGHLHVAIQATAGSSTPPAPDSPAAAHAFGLGISDLLTAADIAALRSMGTESLSALRDLGAKDLQVLTKILIGAVERKVGFPIFGSTG